MQSTYILAVAKSSASARLEPVELLSIATLPIPSQDSDGTTPPNLGTLDLLQKSLSPLLLVRVGFLVPHGTSHKRDFKMAQAGFEPATLGL